MSITNTDSNIESLSIEYNDLTFDPDIINNDPCDLIDCAEGYICDQGECVCNAEEDCFGECGGNGVVDDCGVCGGDGSSCSDNGGNINGFTLSVVDNDTYFDSDSEIFLHMESNVFSTSANIFSICNCFERDSSM